MRDTKRSILFTACGVAALLAGGHSVAAQPPTAEPPAINASEPARFSEQSIRAASAPYRIEWNGRTGTLITHPLTQEAEVRTPLLLLRSEPGPAGYAKHLVWFLARETDGFTLLWCYLNDTGQDFYCWMYRFPANQLTTLRFTGDYRYPPAAEIAPSPPDPAFTIRYVPRYTGPAFAYRNWATQNGTLASLDLRPAETSPQPLNQSSVDSSLTPPLSPASVALLPSRTGTSPVASPATSAPRSAPTRTLTQLVVAPLHEIHVAAGNGWRAGGWRELHALALDSAKDPYYLILYSNTTQGYAIDMRRGQVFAADFGERVRFGNEPALTGTPEQTLDLTPEVRVRRYARHEIAFELAQEAPNPFADVAIEVDFHAPSGKKYLVPAFWDGGKTFRVRLAPTEVGTWTWRINVTSAPELRGQSGTFECVADETKSAATETPPSNGTRTQAAKGTGFVRVIAAGTDHHHFIRSNGVPFLPAFLRDPVQYDEAATRGAGTSPPDSHKIPASFSLFQKRMDAAANLGFNRLFGGYLLDRPAPGAIAHANEGGTAFVNNDISRLNPAYFQWMDRRIAYCNTLGIVPDIGLGVPSQGFFTTYSAQQLQRVWRYVVARYAGYDVCWNLASRDDAPVPAETASKLETVAALTRLYDPYQHPITTITPGLLALPAAPRVAGSEPGPDPTSSPVAGLRLAGQTDNGGNGSIRPRRTRRPEAPPPLFAPDTFDWQDVITLRGGDLRALDALYSFDRPVVLTERAASEPSGSSGTEATGTVVDPDIARQRLWETRMRGAYWAGSQPARRLDSPDGSSVPEIDYAASCARFFAQTRFWRLQPHPEALGGLEVSSVDRRRRRRAEADATRSNGTGGAGSGNTPPNSSLGTAPPAPTNGSDTPPLPTTPAGLPPLAPLPTSPAFVLADPAWEYVVYFEAGGTATLDLIEATGALKMRWFNPRLGQFGEETTLTGGSYHTFTAPDKNDWVLYLSRR